LVAADDAEIVAAARWLFPAGCVAPDRVWRGVMRAASGVVIEVVLAQRPLAAGAG